MQPPTGGWGAPCPVCGRPSGDTGTGPCPQCGLPAVAQAALVVARIGATLTELTRDRDALLSSLRAAAPGPAHPAAPPAWGAPPVWGPPPPAWTPQLPPPAPAPQAPQVPAQRRLSPQQVLLSLGALLVVAAAVTFVAVAWTQLGVVFQSVVMLVVTTLLCGASAWTARRALRATEEALAAAGAALIAVDLAAARWLGLFRLEEVPLRLWWAVSCAVLVAVGVLLGRLTRTTATWPLVALLAAQPLPFLLLTGELFTGPVGVAVALAVAAGDVVTAHRIRPLLGPLAWVLAGMFAAGGAVAGLAVAAGSDALESWFATLILAIGGAAAVLLATRWTGPRFSVLVPGGVGLVVGTALALSLRTLGDSGLLVAAAIGIVLLVGAVLTVGRATITALLAAGGAAATLVPAGLLVEDRRLGEFALVALGLTVPAVLAAVRVPVLRSGATGTALLAPLVAVLCAHGDAVLSAPVAGLLLAVLGAVAFGLATLRSGRPEEWVCAAAGALAGAAAGSTTATIGAWGQVAVQLGMVGAAAGCYAVVAGRRPVAVLAVTDLVVASWIAVAGAHIETPEAYTLPAAVGLLLIALPNLRRGAPSWAAEGAAVGVALVPSALVVVSEPTALRLVLVVAAATTAVVVGALLHRQAPFVLGAGTLCLVLVGRLVPYTPLLPWWVTLGIPGLLLFVVGATYERRRQQAREAVAWVTQMR